MNFKYIKTRDDTKKGLSARNKKINLIYLIIATVIYFCLTKNIISNNFWLVIIIFIFYLLGLLFLFWLIDTLFVYVLLKINDKVTNKAYGLFECKVNKDGFVLTNGDNIFETKWDEIKRIMIKDNIITIIIKNKKYGLVFEKQYFEKESDFDRLKEKINQYKKED